MYRMKCIYIRVIHLTFIITCGINIATIKLCSAAQKEKGFNPTLKSLRVYTVIPEHLAPEVGYNIPQMSLKQLVSKIQAHQAPSKCMLKIKGTNRKALVCKGIVLDRAQHNTISVISRGYAKRDVMLANDYLELVKKGGGIIAAHMMLKDNIITNAACITFDYPDERWNFNFGQELDVHCLQTVWDSILQAHPQARIIGLGDCRGAKALLALATKKPKNLDALILISPFVSTLDMIQQISKYYLNLIPKSDVLLHEFFKTYFPRYNALQDMLLSEVHKIDPDLPIFIGQRKNDYLASDASINRLVARLRKAGNNNIELAMVSDNNATHSRITPIPALQKAVRNFLHTYQLG